VVLPFGISLVACGVQGQRIMPAGSGQITSTTASVRAGAVARGPGGEQAGQSSFAVSEEKARVVSGKVAGYGLRSNAGALAEYAARQNPRSSFSAGGDFPASDFVATMPQPIIARPLPGLSPADSFGVTLSTPQFGVGKSDVASPHPHTKAIPHAKTFDPDAILNPFTHSMDAGLGPKLTVVSPGGSRP